MRASGVVESDGRLSRVADPTSLGTVPPARGCLLLIDLHDIIVSLEEKRNDR